MRRQSEGPFDTVGWGLFTLPGERKRLREAEQARLAELDDTFGTNFAAAADEAQVRPTKARLASSPRFGSNVIGGSVVAKMPSSNALISSSERATRYRRDAEVVLKLRSGRVHLKLDGKSLIILDESHKYISSIPLTEDETQELRDNIESNDVQSVVKALSRLSGPSLEDIEKNLKVRRAR